ncbi:MAG: YdcF family protein, partial [Actinobacteria bacterium]|nr:YdcF family protein [Actinomycetota bacterium]
VVMGAAQYDGRPSALLQERLERALALWNDGHARWVAVTGGKKAGDRFTEAGTSAAWLVKRGVPESRILYEETGRSTWESLSNLAPVLRWNGVESALMVTTDWHLARSVHSLRELGFRVEPARAGTRHSLLDQRWYRETAGVGIGRVVGFDRLHTVTG